MVNRKALLGIVLVCIVGLQVWGATDIRLAIVPTGEPTAQTAADLLTAELSKRQGLQLLERAEVARVYQEQGLSAANRARLDYLKLGQMLGADGLVVLEGVKEGTSQSIMARLVAVKPGVLLAEIQTPWSVNATARWTKWVTNDFGPLLPKLSVLAKDAVPLSILNLRSALQTAPGRELEKELTVLLIHRLTREREVFVLERQHLAEALFEKQFQPQEESPFWTGRFLLEGVLDKEGVDPNRVTLSARLVSPAGGPTIPIELGGPRTNLVALADSLVGQVLAALHRSPSTTEWRPLEEAEQYFQEGQWARRWGLKVEARAASESAWALGKRSPDLAAVRIRSYMDGIPLIYWTSDSRLPVQPPMPYFAKIAPATRALELFVDASARFGVTNVTAEADWPTLGFDALSLASGLLENFHRLVEAQAGYEAPLKELRLQARLAAAAMPWRASFFYQPGQVQWAQFKWDWGGLWYDKWEDAWEMYYDSLEQGWHSPGPPRLTAWSWEERKRLPKLQQQFIQRLCQSTNPDVRWEGLFWSAKIEPPPPDGNREARLRALADATWEQRQEFYSKQMNASAFARMQGALRPSDDGSAMPELFAGLVSRLRKDYLLNASVLNHECFIALFAVSIGGNYKLFPEAEARELLPLLADFKKRLRIQPPDDWSVERAKTQLLECLPKGSPAAVAQPVAQTDAQQPGTGADKPIPVSLVPLQSPPNVEGRHPLGFACYRQGRLWCLVYDHPEYAAQQRPGPEAWVVAVDLSTAKQEVFPLPAELGRPAGALEVTEDALYTTGPGRLLRYPFKTRQWESIEAPIPEGARLSWLDGRLYLATKDSILEFLPDTRLTQVIGSGRRRPAVNQLDRIGAVGDFGYPELFHAPGGGIGTIVQNRLLTRLPGSTEWQELGLAPFAGAWALHPVVVGTNRLLLEVNGNRTRARVLEVQGEKGGMEALLENRFIADVRDGRADKVLPVPRWHWPQGFPLDASCLQPEGKGLWALVPPHWMTRTMDGSEVTVFRFEPELPEPLRAGVRLEMDGQPYRLIGGMAGTGSKFFSCLLTPAGLVLVDTARFMGGPSGYWLISPAALEAKFAALRPALQAKAQAEQTWQQSLLARFDANKNGVLDPSELALAHQEPACLEHERPNIDADGNGVLDADELRYFDVNNNGIIEQPERQAIRLFDELLARQALANFGGSGAQSLTPEQWQKFFDTIRLAVPPVSGKNPEADAVARGSFADFDRDHNGALDLKELTDFMEQRFSTLDLAGNGYALAETAPLAAERKTVSAAGAAQPGGLNQ